jgi:hypothetical protein
MDERQISTVQNACSLQWLAPLPPPTALKLVYVGMMQFQFGLSQYPTELHGVVGTLCVYSYQLFAPLPPLCGRARVDQLHFAGSSRSRMGDFSNDTHPVDAPGNNCD